MGLWDDEVVR